MRKRDPAWLRNMNKEITRLHEGRNHRGIGRCNELDWHKEARIIKEAEKEAENYKEGREIFSKDDADDPEGKYVFKYRCVQKRTDKAVLVSFSACRKWLPKSTIEFLPGCLVRVNPAISFRSGLMAREKPEIYKESREK